MAPSGVTEPECSVGAACGNAFNGHSRPYGFEIGGKCRRYGERYHRLARKVGPVSPAGDDRLRSMISAGTVGHTVHGVGRQKGPYRGALNARPATPASDRIILVQKAVQAARGDEDGVAGLTSQFGEALMAELDV